VPKTIMPKLTFAAAAVAAALAAATCFDVPAASASGGNAPWCAVIDYGDGGVSWECNYRTFEECYPNVIAGNKGSCNVNPEGPSASASRPVAHTHRKRHASLRH
jgi:hypothetical protein